MLLFALVAGCSIQPTGRAVNFPTAYTMDPREFRADGVSTSHIAVGFKKDVDAAKFGNKYGLRVHRSISALKATIFDLPLGTVPESLVSKIEGAEKTDVEYAETISKGSLEKQVNDPLVNQQYALEQTGAFGAWDVTMGEKTTIIALIDSGVDPQHPDLVGKIVSKYNVFTKNDEVKDGTGHGTHCAGIAAAAADNNEGIAGMAPQCGLMIVQAFDADGVTSTALLAEAITWAADHGAKVISMSFGIYGESELMSKAVNYAYYTKDAVLVASAGNDQKRTDAYSAPHIPATLHGVLEVSATDKKGKLASFCNWGSQHKVAAPGVDILSTFPTYPVKEGKSTNYAVMSGTSMATPCVAGFLALIRSQHPDWNRLMVIDHVQKSTVDIGPRGGDDYFGYGLIDARKGVGGN